MRSISRQTARISLLLLVTSSLLAGCGLGGTVGTQNLRPAGSGVHTSIENILIQDVLVVEAEDGTLSLSASILSKAEAADNLTAVLFAGTPATLTPVDQVLTPGQVVRFGYQASNYADLKQTTYQAGQTIKVAFVFASGLKAEVQALIVPHSNPMYSEITPAPTAG